MKHYLVMLAVIVLFGVVVLHFCNLYRHERRYENVMDYGATGDGITDDSDSIQRAIDGATAKKKSVYFHKGKFLITKPVVVFDNTPIVGVGKGISIINMKRLDYYSPK